MNYKMSRICFKLLVYSLSYIQFKANKTFWHLVTECSRLRTYKEEIILDNNTQQDN